MPFNPCFLLLLLIVFGGAPARADEEQGSPSLYQVRIERLKLYTTFRQGKHFFRVGEYLEAAAYFHYLRSRIAELPPEWALEVTYYLGSSLLEAGLLPQSRPLLIEAFRVRNLPGELRYALFSRLFRLAHAYQSRGDILRLLPLLGREPFSEEEKDELRFLALSLLFDLQAYPEVLALGEQIPPASPRYPESLLLLALAQAYLGRFPEALQKMGRLFAMEDHPVFKNPELKELMQRAYLAIAFEAGDYRRSLTLLSQFYPDTQDPDLLYYKAWTLLLSRNFGEARDAFTHFLLTYPQDPRTLEVALLPGYVDFAQGKLGESYAFFATMEGEFQGIETRVRALRSRFPTVEEMLRYMEGVTAPPNSLYRTLSQWIRNDPLLQLWQEKLHEIQGVRNEIHNLRWNLVRLKISLSTLGSRLDHPISFDYRLRYIYERQLFNLRSHILEMMLRPIRHLLVYQEYRYVNIAQDLRFGVLKILDQDVKPLRERVITLMDQVRGLRDYLRLLSDVRYSEEVTRAQGERVVLPLSYLELGNLLIVREDELGEMLHSIYLIEEELWKVIAFSFDLEYTTATMATKRLGIWNAPHLEPLRQMYQTAQGVDEILRENAALGEKTRKEMLAFLRVRLNQELQEWEGVARRVEALERFWEIQQGQRVMDLAYENTVQLIADGRLRAVQGKIDIRWARKQILERASGLVHEIRANREEELKGYYEEIERILKSIEEKEAMLKATPGRELSLEEARELFRTLEALEGELSRVEAALSRLRQGSAAILHRPGTLPVPSTYNPQTP